MDPQSNSRPSASLQSLPDELLQSILETLCPHCYVTRDYQQSRDRQHGLESITLTSKRLLSIALPIMLHVPANHISDEGLHKLLDIHPSLGDHIREWELPQIETDKEVLDRMMDTTRKLLATVSQDFDREQAENDGLSVQHSLMTELFMARAPRMEKLSLERFDYNDWPAADLKYLARRLGKLGDGTGFECVRHLSVTRPCRTTTSLTDGHIMALLGVMPKLEVLNLDSIIGFPASQRFDISSIKPALRNLRSLRLEWCIFEGNSPTSDYGALCEMLEHAPNLNSFFFSARNSSGAPGFVDHELSMRDLLLGLRPVAKHLKHLELKFLDTWCEHGGVTGSILANFTALESFHVSLEGICQCDPPHTDNGEPAVAPCTADIIPPTVKYLSLILPKRDATGCSRCIVGIGRKAAEGGLQNLETVRIVYTGWTPQSLDEPYTGLRYDDTVQNLQDWHQAFQGAHVALRFKSRIYEWLRYHKNELAWMEGNIEQGDYDW